MKFDEFVQQFRAEVIERSHGGGDDTSLPDFKENIFTEIMCEYLYDFGALDEATVCYCDQKTSIGSIKANGYFYDEEEDVLSLIVTIFGNGDLSGRIGKTDLQQAKDRLLRFFRQSIKGFHEEMEPSSDRYSMLRRIFEVKDRIEQVKVFVFVNGNVSDENYKSIIMKKYGYEFRFHIWDLQRVFRCVSSGKSYESTLIDFKERFGETIPCISMKERAEDYIAYVAIIPGRMLHDIYDEYGSRLLELNVRSFLQVNGKVNKGIRSTLRDEPDRFLAYNNGISATAEDIELTSYENGMYAINNIRGLQVVNGGQTIASIHRAAKFDKVDLSQVYVQAKITIVDSGKLEDMVPLIARYANSQNKINEADFSSNEPYHVEIQRLSERIWVPGEQSRWFYERARGQYQVLKSREATTPAKKKKFEKTIPASQKFTLTDLAKFIYSWDGFPHLVSMGAQKNFVRFMEELRKKYDKEWKPDVEYYKDLISKAILFKSTDKIVKQLQIPAYRANVVTYTIAYIAHRSVNRINLNNIWERQSISEGLEEAIRVWCPIIYDRIVSSAAGANVTEWCKNPRCWMHISGLTLDIPQSLQKELDLEPIITVSGNSIDASGDDLTSEERENLAKIMRVDASRWLDIHGWGMKTGLLETWQCGIAHTLSGYASAGWKKTPTVRQVKQAVKILEIADQSMRIEA